jgi:hypothetical protein
VHFKDASRTILDIAATSWQYNFELSAMGTI